MIVSKLSVFVCTLLIGIVGSWLLVSGPQGDTDIATTRTDLCTGFSFEPVSKTEEFHAEFVNVAFDDRTKHVVMLLEFVRKGEVHECIDVPENDNSKWLALTKRGEQYSIEKRDVKYGPVRRTDFGSFSKMRFAGSNSTLLLLSDQGTLRPGAVQTIYWKKPLNDDGTELYADGLEIGDKRTFSLNGLEYGVRVAPAILKGGNKLSALILETGSQSQIIWFRSYFYPDEVGELDWIGDLDGDNRVDLLFSSYAQNGGQLQAFLFLSSFAVDNNLVGLAGLSYGKCQN